MALRHMKSAGKVSRERFSALFHGARAQRRTLAPIGRREGKSGDENGVSSPPIFPSHYISAHRKNVEFCPVALLGHIAPPRTDADPSFLPILVKIQH